MATVTKLSVLSRAMSSSAQMVTPPVRVFGLPGRYATALYSAAVKTKELEQVEKDLNAFKNTLKENPKLRIRIINPIVNRQVMGKALKDGADALRWAKSTGNLLALLAENGRLNALDSIINAFQEIMAGHRGEVVCEVVTAKPLDSSQNKQLESALKTFLTNEQSLKITYSVDPSIIGGMIVSIGDKYVDMSIASKVKMFTDVISSPA